MAAARRGRPKRGGGGGGASDKHEFPEEDVPNPGMRESTLAGAGYAPDLLVLTKIDMGDIGAVLPMLPRQSEVLNDAVDRTYKAVLVVNVPRNALYTDATQWGAFDTSVTLNAMHARSVSYLLATVHHVARSSGRVRVFAELMVRESMGLPPTANRELNMEPVFHPSNVMGYRLWIVFGQGAPDPERALRQCMFGVQAYMGLVPHAIAELKAEIMTESDEVERARKLEEYARQHSKKRRPAAEGPAKRRAGGGGSGSDDEPMGDAGSDNELPAAPEADDKVDVTALRQLVRTQPPSNLVARLNAHRFRYLGNLWLGVGTLDTYLRDVVGSAHVLCGSALMTDFATRWGVAPALALPDAEAVSLAEASVDGAAAAERCWSFARSVAVFYDEVREHSACTEQLTAAEYGIDEDQIHFPFPNLVWELAPSGLNPINFFSERMPWTAPRFEPAARRIVSALGEQELPRTLPAAAAAHIAANIREPAHLRVQGAMAGMARARVLDGGDRSALQQAVALIRTADAPGAPDALSARRVAYRADVAHKFACVELTREYSLAPYVDIGDTGCVRTEHLMAAVIPVYQDAQRMMDRSLEALQKLAAPAGVDAGVWRYAETLRLHALYRLDVQAALIGTIARGIGVPEVYQTALARIRESGRLSDAYTSDWCRLPQMSVEANAMIAMASKLIAGINMMHGMLETMTYLTVSAVQSGDPEPRDMNHTLTYGQAGSSKSWNIERANEALLPGALIDRDWQSAASAYTHTNDSNKISFRDEANEILTNQTAGAQRRNAEALARLKMQLTKGVFSFDRYHKDENARRSETLRVQARRPMIETALANVIDIDSSADPALLDRYNVGLFAPFATMSDVTAVERAHDPLSKDRRELWAHYCEMHKTEIAFKTLLVVLARAGVIASINTDVLKTMLAEALADATDYMPSLGESMRTAGRNEQYAIALIFHTAYYTVMRSEASELLSWAHVGAPHRVQPAFLDDVATIFGPHMYARADHGCWMLTQMVRTSLPFPYYIVLLIIASTMCFFRRSFMAYSYRRDRARLIDDAVAERLASRDEAGRAMPEFVQELLRIETVLDNTVVQRRGANVAPAFYEQGNVRDPNWIVIDGKMDAIAQRVTSTIQRYYKMDASQIRTLLGHAMARISLQVPEYETQSTGAPLTEKSLAFRRDSRDKQNNTIAYTKTPIIRLVKGNEPRMLISTGALMIPPQMLLVLMLTAAENKHTEPLQTVLPIELYGNSQLMHTWRVSRRPANDPVFVNRNAMTHSSMRMERRSGSVVTAKMANIVQTSGTDIVRAAFYRHMRELHQMPPYATVRAELIRIARETGDAAATARFEALPADYPPPEDFELVFRAWADASPAAPGAAVARRAWAYQASPELAAEAANRNNVTYYPQSNALDHAVQTFLMHQLRGAPMAPIPRRNNHVRVFAASLAAMQIDDLPMTAAPVPNSYPAHREFVRGIMLRLCGGEWFRPHFLVYSASVEWQHLFTMLVDAVWGQHSAAARTLADTGAMPTEPAPMTARQFACHSRLPALTFRPCYLTMLAAWLHFVNVTRRIGIAFVRDPSIRSVQHAYDSLIELDVAPDDLRLARLIDSVRAADADVEIPPAILDQYRHYLAAMDRLRPLRAARLAALVKTATDMATAEDAVDAVADVVLAQADCNRQIAALSMERMRPGVQNS